MDDNKKQTNSIDQQDNMDGTNQPEGINDVSAAVVKKPKKISALIILMGIIIIALAAAVMYLVFIRDDSKQASVSTVDNGSQTEQTSQQVGGFQADTDAFVKDFEVYKTFGGKFALPTKSVTYTVFFPEKFGFNLESDRLQLSYGNGIPADDTGQDSNKACKTVEKGVECQVTWLFDEASLQEQEYMVSFKVLDNTTHQKGRVFVSLQGDLYAENGATVFIKKPLTYPYVVMSGIDNPLVVTDSIVEEDLKITVSANGSLKTQDANLYLDEEPIQVIAEPKIIEDQNYIGGKRAEFTFTIPFSKIKELSKGTHKINVRVTGTDFDVSAVTEGADPGGAINIIVQ